MTNVGLDPRKRNVATMSDSKGTTLKYTARQRNFESKLTRYRGILAKEKEVRGMLPFEVELSNHSSKTNDESSFWDTWLRKRSSTKTPSAESFTKTTFGATGSSGSGRQGRAAKTGFWTESPPHTVTTARYFTETGRGTCRWWVANLRPRWA